MDVVDARMHFRILEIAFGQRRANDPRTDRVDPDVKRRQVDGQCFGHADYGVFGGGVGAT